VDAPLGGAHGLHILTPTPAPACNILHLHPACKQKKHQQTPSSQAAKKHSYPSYHQIQSHMPTHTDCSIPQSISSCCLQPLQSDASLGSLRLMLGVCLLLLDTPGLPLLSQRAVLKHHKHSVPAWCISSAPMKHTFNSKTRHACMSMFILRLVQALGCIMIHPSSHGAWLTKMKHPHTLMWYKCLCWVRVVHLDLSVA
jgi:hypothetical protein